jgi:hypothetical protein
LSDEDFDATMNYVSFRHARHPRRHDRCGLQRFRVAETSLLVQFQFPHQLQPVAIGACASRRRPDCLFSQAEGRVFALYFANPTVVTILGVWISRMKSNARGMWLSSRAKSRNP